MPAIIPLIGRPYFSYIAFALLLVGIAPQCTLAVDLIGYVPYWEMSSSYNSSVLPKQLSMLNEVRYFGLTAASNGTVVPLAGSGSLQSHLDRIATIQQKISALPEAQRPRLNITLGGAGEDTTFSDIARTVNNVPCNLCATFAQSIDTLLDTTGATSVDIDWEHPNAGFERSTSYPAMLQRIKQELGPDRRVYATVDPTVIISNSVFTGPNAIDGVSLMTYDLGWWGNDPANPFQGEHSLPAYVEDAFEAWSEPPGSPNDRPWVFGSWGNNVSPAKLGVGLPFYAHAVTGPDTTPTYSELVAAGSTTDSNYFTYQGRSVWIPGPSLAEQRVQFAQDHGLQHVIIWELGHDVSPTNPYSLLYRALTKNLGLELVPGDYDADRDVDAADYAIWRGSFGQKGFGRAADGTADQAVDAADYVLWRKFATAAAAASAAQVPEPSSLGLLALVLASLPLQRFRKPR